ncbi:RidA family protein [Micromonospora echinospora]|uniref:RidA family protein n=1 Tax=Micromonospora echinospora TaxID=1877 RepID=UPI0034010F3A
MSQIDSYSRDVSGEKEFGFAQSIKVGDTIYVSGQLSHDAEGTFLYPNDLSAQLPAGLVQP